MPAVKGRPHTHPGAKPVDPRVAAILKDVFALQVRMELTDAELARLVGISRWQLQNYRTGRYTPTFKVLLKLADVFGYEPRLLRAGELPEERAKREDLSRVFRTNSSAARR